MANNFSSGIWKLDTPSATPIVSFNANVAIRAMKWVSISGAAGDQAVLQDGNGSPVWQGICSGPYYDTGVFELGGRRTVKGLKLLTLGSGILYIYTDAV